MAEYNIWGEEIESTTPVKDRKTHHKYNPKHFQMFGENKIALGREVKNHPELLELLANHAVDELEIMLAEIAAYCGVMLNDSYTESDIENLCGILNDKLVARRTGFVFPREVHPDDKAGGEK